MRTDVLIVGGGPAGSAAAMFLLREGITPVIVEAQPFPRYHIGESMTGEAGGVLRDLGLAPEMYRRQYPTKQGVKVYGQSASGSWFVGVNGRDENWKLFPTDTWQTRRSEFDRMMLGEAVARGATLLRGKAVSPLIINGDVRGAQIRMADGGVQDVHSQVLLDCSGAATWLANLGGVTGPKYLGAYDRQIAFSQVAGAVRDPGTSKETHRDSHRDNTLIFYHLKNRWAWAIPLDDEVVSVGIVIPAAELLARNEAKDVFFRRSLRELHPELARRVAGCPLVEDIHVIPNYSYQVKGFCGRGFMCLGDAHRFIDPVFSFGLTVALREAQFAAPAVRAYLEGTGRDQPNPFADYQLFSEKGIDVLEDFLDVFWEHPMAFGWAAIGRQSDYVIDLMAGRIYPHERQPSPVMTSFRKLLSREGERERSYGSEDLYSIPIGSRYHPERAAIWDLSSPVETTERWTEPR